MGSCRNITLIEKCLVFAKRRLFRLEPEKRLLSHLVVESLSVSTPVKLYYTSKSSEDLLAISNFLYKAEKDWFKKAKIFFFQL